MEKLRSWLIYFVNTSEFLSVIIAMIIVLLLTSCGVATYEPLPCDGKTDCQRG